MYATTTGVYKNGFALPQNLPTLADYFNEAGYHTGYIGKWHLGGTKFSPRREDQEPVPICHQGGYQYWLATDLQEFCSEAYDTMVFDKEGNAVHLPGYRVDALTDAAIRYIDNNKDHPFFLFLSFLEPHHQNTADNYPSPEGYAEQYQGKWMPPDLQALGGSAAYQIGGYFGMVKKLDEGLGRLLDALKSLNILDDTIVIFASDHGNHFKTRNQEYKRSCHESSIRIPIAAQGPVFNGGGDFDHIFSLVDIPPTLLDACKIEQTVPMEGVSALPVLDRKTTEWNDIAFVQISESVVGRAIRTKHWKYGVEDTTIDAHLYNHSETYTETYLYDLQSDPYELVNLVGMEEYGPVSDILRKKLLDKILSIEKFTPMIKKAPKRETAGQRVLAKEAWND
jgi:arylsulfatase A-like enzyme